MTHRSARRATLLAVSLAALASTAAAQNGVPNRETAIEIRARFLADMDSLQGRFLALAEAFPAEKYAWRPGPGVRSVGEVFMHVASEYYVFAPMSYGAPRSPVIPRGPDSFQKFEAMSSKPEVLKHLREGFAYAKQALSALPADSIAGTRRLWGSDRTIIQTTLAMSGDLHEHIGQLVAYARMNGVKPPWSK